MKNIFKARFMPLFGIIALIAIISLGFIGCDTGNGGGGSYEALLGTWESTDDYTLIIDEYEWELLQNSVEMKSGYHDERHPGDLKLHGGGTVYAKASVSGNTLTLKIVSPEQEIVFTK
jgi:hypothetical protein